MARVANLLFIAGSDSGGGAGIQADIKTASAPGVYAATAATAITAPNTVGVQAVTALAAEMVAAPIASVLGDIRVDASEDRDARRFRADRDGPRGAVGVRRAGGD